MGGGDQCSSLRSPPGSIGDGANRSAGPDAAVCAACAETPGMVRCVDGCCVQSVGARAVASGTDAAACTLAGSRFSRARVVHRRCRRTTRHRVRSQRAGSPPHLFVGLRVTCGGLHAQCSMVWMLVLSVGQAGAVNIKVINDVVATLMELGVQPAGPWCAVQCCAPRYSLCALPTSHNCGQPWAPTTSTPFIHTRALHRCKADCKPPPCDGAPRPA